MLATNYESQQIVDFLHQQADKLTNFHASLGSITTDRKPNDTDWLRRAIMKIFYYPQSHLAQETLTL